MKVYGGNSFRHGKQIRVIAAVKSQAEFSRLTRFTRGYIRDYCCETGNKLELEVANSRPGVLFWCPLDNHHGPYLEEDWMKKEKENPCQNQ